MKKFNFKIEVNWLPSVPILNFSGTQEAETESEAKELILDFYMTDLGISDKNDIKFLLLEEAE